METIIKHIACDGREFDDEKGCYEYSRRRELSDLLDTWMKVSAPLTAWEIANILCQDYTFTKKD